MSIRRETHHDDEERTGALLDALDSYAESRDPAHVDGLSDFEDTLMGLFSDPSQPYPPAGHTYPKRG